MEPNNLNNFIPQQNFSPTPLTQPPAQTTPPVSQVPPAVPPVTPQKKSHSVLYAAIIGFLLVLLISSGVLYAYVQKIGPFSVESYSEDNFFSGILVKIAQIDSASYSAYASLSVVPKDKDAVPFEINVPDADALAEKYSNDVQRMNDASYIVRELNSQSKYFGNNSYNKNISDKQLPYPNSISTLLSKKSNYYYSNTPTVNDPVTNKAYDYVVTDGGKNFALTVNFETDFPISAIKKDYYYVSTTTIVSGRKVTFTKNSSSYMYMSNEMPRPFLAELSDQMRYIPADISANGEFKVSSEKKNDQITNWLVNLNAQGDFGDLSYKINIDAIKSDNEYYFKINNIPSIFLFGETGLVKGKWVNVSTKTGTSTDDQYRYSSLSYLKKSIPESEASYKKNREKAFKFIKDSFRIADEVKLISFRSKPSNDKVDGKDYIKYEVSLKKDKIVPYYNELKKLIDSNKDYKDYRYMIDEGLIEYLKSDEFSQVFDYFDKNNKVVFWTDKSGNPAIIENTMRVVPPTTATQLVDKQIKIVFRLTVSDINKNIEINAPKDSVSIDKLIKDADNNNPAGMKGSDAAVKSNLSNIRAQAELAYDSSSNSYGKKAFPLGTCKNTADTLFADASVNKSIEAIVKLSSSATCVSTGVTGNVNAYAVSATLPSKTGYSWCIDSTGSSKEIKGSIKGASCK